MKRKLLFTAIAIIGFATATMAQTQIKKESIFKVKDFDGNLYDTIHIGTQIWLKQNLKTTHYKNGKVIPIVADYSAWAALARGAYCDYDNTSANSITYGRLYNWYAVNTGSLCPTGWHVPTDAEWTTLTTYLGGEAIAGDKLKKADIANWTWTTSTGANQSGFNALPGGSRYWNGSYDLVGNNGHWWSSTEINTKVAWFMGMIDNTSTAIVNGDTKQTGFSVRCLRD